MNYCGGYVPATRKLNNVKNSLMSIAHKILLRKRASIKTVNNELKNIVQIEYSRQDSLNILISNLLESISAYCFFEKKPAIELNFSNDGQLLFFEFISNSR